MSLPNGYKRLEYIQSTGTQYVNSGFIPNQDTRVIMDCKANSLNSNGSFLFGTRTSYIKNAFEVALTTSQTFHNYGTKYQFANFSYVLERMTIDANKNVCTFSAQSGSVSITLDTATFTAPTALIIGSAYDSGSIFMGASAWNGYIYSCKIYDNGTLIRDYIPCQTTAGEIGLWDDVNSVFYGNAGTGTFTAGPVIAIATDKSEIVELEYIQSSGTQYVDTLFNPTQNTKLVLDMAFLGSAGTNVAGVRNNSSDTTNRFGIISFGSTSKLGAFFRDSSIQAVTFDNNRHLCDLSKDGIVFDGTSYGGANTGSFTCTYSLTLFAWNNGADGVTCNLCKVYSCQIYDNGTLIRDYIPCQTTSGDIGLWDDVNSVFYGNAGTGTFTAGPAVASPSIFVNINGIWKPINHIYVNINNIWQKST